MIEGLIALEERPGLTYDFPRSQAREGCMKGRMELVAPDERRWNQALSVCVAVPRNGLHEATDGTCSP